MALIPTYMKGQDINLYQDELNVALQQNISDNGLVTPSQTTVSITDLAAVMPDGTSWVDSDTNELKIKLGGIIKVVQTV
jgi:hypothetical protein